jgi:hypothetical protein
MRVASGWLLSCGSNDPSRLGGEQRALGVPHCSSSVEGEGERCPHERNRPARRWSTPVLAILEVAPPERGAPAPRVRTMTAHPPGTPRWEPLRRSSLHSGREVAPSRLPQPAPTRAHRDARIPRIRGLPEAEGSVPPQAMTLEGCSLMILDPARGDSLVHRLPSSCAWWSRTTCSDILARRHYTPIAKV